VRGPRRVRVPNQNGQPEPEGADPENEEPAPAARPNNPFGVQPGVGSSRPGTITPVPRQNRNGQDEDQEQ
jgi:hypothetical protein